MGMKTIDINCDMGEGSGAEPDAVDRELLTLVTSINIACGAHAGSPELMASTLRLAKSKGVAIGAHPGYADRQNFGRREMALSADEVEDLVWKQIELLAGIARAEKTDLVHVKPHGALYNQAARDFELSRVIARTVRRFSPGLILVGLAGSRLVEAGLELGIPVAREGFPERAYEPDGSLRSRSLPGALISDAGMAAEQGLRLAMEGITISGTQTPIETLCIHSDSPGATGIARKLRDQLAVKGFHLQGLRKNI